MVRVWVVGPGLGRQSVPWLGWGRAAAGGCSSAARARAGGPARVGGWLLGGWAELAAERASSSALAPIQSALPIQFRHHPAQPKLTRPQTHLN